MPSSYGTTLKGLNIKNGQQNKGALNEGGFTLLEMLITIAVLGVCVTLLCSLFYSLYVTKNNTFADADTTDGINILENYINSVFSSFDIAEKRFAVLVYGTDSTEGIPLDNDNLPQSGSNILAFYSKQANNSYKPVFSVYVGSSSDGKLFFTGKSNTDEISDFRYTLPDRISDIAFTAFTDEGKKTDGTTLTEASLLRYEIKFKNTKGKYVSKTIILTKKTSLEK